ncbi:hypothetical protein [Polaribacter staleyi]|uniref:hypothetical protein n=1 Tax=Polaribacter staleyi TaxID=2022337 RepID=UPI0031BB08B4
MKNLQNYGVQELNTHEITSTNGGLPPWVKKLGWLGLAAEVIDNWSSIKSGIVDGWNEN